MAVIPAFEGGSRSAHPPAPNPSIGTGAGSEKFKYTHHRPHIPVDCIRCTRSRE
jgi:hypothetical protein